MRFLYLAIFLAVFAAVMAVLLSATLSIPATQSTPATNVIIVNATFACQLLNSSSGSTLIWNFGNNQVNVTPVAANVNGITLPVPASVIRGIKAVTDCSKKFTYNVTATISNNFNVTVFFAVNSTEPIVSIVNNSRINYNDYFVDFSDIAFSNVTKFNVSIVKDNANNATIAVNRWFATGATQIGIDPIVGSALASGSRIPFSNGAFSSKLWYANGIYWLFFDNGTLYYTSSSNGSVWNPAVNFPFQSSDGSYEEDVYWNGTAFLFGYRTGGEAATYINATITNVEQLTAGSTPAASSGSGGLVFAPTIRQFGAGNIFITGVVRPADTNAQQPGVAGWAMYNGTWNSGAATNTFPQNRSLFTNGMVNGIPTMECVNSTDCIIFYANTSVNFQANVTDCKFSAGSCTQVWTTVLENSATLGWWMRPVIYPNGTSLFLYTTTDTGNLYYRTVDTNGVNSSRNTAIAANMTSFCSNGLSSNPLTLCNITVGFDNYTSTVFVFYINQSAIWMANLTTAQGWSAPTQIITGLPVFAGGPQDLASMPTSSVLNVTGNNTLLTFPLAWKNGDNLWFGQYNFTTSIVGSGFNYFYPNKATYLIWSKANITASYNDTGPNYGRLSASTWFGTVNYTNSSYFANATWDPVGRIAQNVWVFYPVLMPIISVNNTTFAMNLTIDFNNGTVSYGNNNTVVTVIKPTVAACGNLPTLPNGGAVSLFTYNETPNINATTQNNTVDTTFLLYDGVNRTTNSTVAFELANNTNYNVCLYPTATDIQADAAMIYTGTVDVNVPRTYYLVNTTLNTLSVLNTNLYLLQTNLASQVKLQLTDASLNRLAGYYIQVQKWYPQFNLFQTILVVKTDNNGEAITYLQLTNSFYKFLVFNGNTLVFTTPQSQVFCATANCVYTITTGTSGSQFFQFNGKLSGVCAYTNSTLTLSCTWGDISGLTKSICLHVKDVGPTQTTEISSQCQIGTGGTIGYTFTSYNKTKHYTFSLEGLFGGLIQNSTILSAGAIDFSSTIPTYALNGLIIGFLIIGTVAFIGLFMPEAAIILSVAAFGFTVQFGLINFGLNTASVEVVFAIVAAIMIYLMHRRF